MAEICEQRALRNKRRGFGWDKTEALVRWTKLCGPQPLDASDLNLFVLLTNEIAAKNEAQREELRTMFVELAEEMIAQGIPMEQCGLFTYREMDRQARDAEEALLCALYTCLSSETPKQRSNDGSPMAAPLVARWHFGRRSLFWRLAYACVSALDYLGHTFIFANLWGANLEGADLTDADFTEANLASANLAGANLTAANLLRANLRGAVLTDADLRNAKGWQNAVGLDLEQVAPERRPEGWEKHMVDKKESSPPESAVSDDVPEVLETDDENTTGDDE